MNNPNTFLRKWVSVACVLAFIGIQTPAHIAVAQSTAPQTWQQTATGLLGQSNDKKSTAGLSFSVKQDAWPSLQIPGGFKEAYGPIIGPPQGIDLGQIKVPSATGAFTSERADWAHNEMTFTYGGSNALKVWASRLSPALLVQSPSSAVQLFAGAVKGMTADGTTAVSRAAAPSYPKYSAFSSSGTAQVRTLSTASTALAMDKNWMLLWYAGNSHFADTKLPLSYGVVPGSYAYQADAPLLLVFQNTPTAIKHSAEGGVELSFSGAAGYIVVLPLFGRNLLRNSQTSGWASALPADVLQKVSFWSARLCSFPVTAAESYAYDDAQDTATISEAITFKSVCSGGTSFAPIPPMLGIVKDALGVTFSGAVVDGNLPTEFGPTLGIENTQQYTWRLKNLKKYAEERPRTGSGQVPAEIEQELSDQANRVVAAGHLRPWILMDAVPRNTSRGDLYWANPADSIFHLSQVARALPGGTTKQNLLTYLRTERSAYPPEDVFDLNLTQGAIRTNFSKYWGDWDYNWNTFLKEVHQKRVPLYNFYALAEYYDLTGDALPATLMTKATQTLDKDMREQDWATSFWFKGFSDRKVAIVNANRHFAGLVGYIRLAAKAGDSTSRQLGMALLAKAAVLRAGMAMYPRFLYGASLVELPATPDWQPRYSSGSWFGFFYNFNWTTANDDQRQITFLDQFGPYLFDHAGMVYSYDLCCLDNSYFPNSYLIAYRDLTPELGRFLSDTVKQDAQIYLDKSQALFPHWYAAFAEATLGLEHNIAHPIDSFQLFLAQAWLKGDTAQNLARYADMPWLEVGDLFFMHKLAEAIKAYRGVAWATTGDTVLIGQTRTQTSGPFKKGDAITLYLDMSSSPGPITNTVRMTTTIPTGLAYTSASLKVEPNDAGTIKDSQSPTLTWQGTLDRPITIRFDVRVTEDKARTLEVAFVVEDKPGRTQTYRQSLPVNVVNNPTPGPTAVPTTIVPTVIVPTSIVPTAVPTARSTPFPTPSPSDPHVYLPLLRRN